MIFPRDFSTSFSNEIFSGFQLEDFKIAQKEQERQIEKEISNRERDINCLKHYRSRCADIVRSNKVFSNELIHWSV